MPAAMALAAPFVPLATARFGRVTREGRVKFFYPRIDWSMWSDFAIGGSAECRPSRMRTKSGRLWPRDDHGGMDTLKGLAGFGSLT